jgi:Holliday junction resolvase RusA-like endonuclease
VICSFVIQGEPVPCARARVFARRGKIVAVTPEKTRGYEHIVGLVARTKRPRGWRLDWASYSIKVTVYRAVRRGDGDNYQKAVADGLTGVLWQNDSAAHAWTVDIVDDLAKPRIEVIVETLGDQDIATARKARAKQLRDAKSAAKGKMTKARHG